MHAPAGRGTYAHTSLLLLARRHWWIGERPLLARALSTGWPLLVRRTRLAWLSRLASTSSQGVVAIVHQRSCCQGQYRQAVFERLLADYATVRSARQPAPTRLVLLEPEPRGDGTPFQTYGDKIDLFLSENAPAAELLGLAGRLL